MVENEVYMILFQEMLQRIRQEGFELINVLYGQLHIINILSSVYFFELFIQLVLCSLHLKLEIKTPAMFEICVQSLIKTIFSPVPRLDSGFQGNLYSLSSISTKYGIFIYFFTNFLYIKIKEIFIEPNPRFGQWIERNFYLFFFF